MRRIVLGHDESGKTQVLADEDVPPITIAMLPGAQVHRMWELDETPSLPVTTAQAPGVATSFFPGPNGARFGFITVPPGLSYDPPAHFTPEDLEAAAAEAEAKLPGMFSTFNPEQPGIHATQTVDFVVVVSGEGLLRTDTGVEIPLHPGDCIVQNGSGHAWHNNGTEPFVFCYSLIGAR
ncbi:cupin domain-containing protein [Nocardia paucivorans]|uniref:cupin domain-containing protein n=1 Tax=Nocardia paucivorans TaxID=114259 RepID=UPI000688AA26|nr:cupin domain-containing protein [Nocardia paucivorans]